MTYQTEIAKQQVPYFIELYEVTFGSGDNVELAYFTSNFEDVTHNAITYLARPIQRSNIEKNWQEGIEKITIKFGFSDTFANYITTAPNIPIHIRILRKIVASSDIVVIFDGTMLMISLVENVCELTLENGVHTLNNEFPSITYQARCNWTLFSSECGLNKNTYRVTAVLNGISSDGMYISSATFAGFPDGYFDLGTIQWGDDFRMITRHVGSVINLHCAFDNSLGIGGTVKALCGCDKSRTTCLGKFNNYANFCGFIHIPDQNPVVYGFNGAVEGQNSQAEKDAWKE